jgi:NADP-dependent 3-hydroxy acid dehydrogenase YdfG
MDLRSDHESRELDAHVQGSVIGPIFSGAGKGWTSSLLFKAFAAAGSKLVLVDRDFAGLQALEKELDLPHGRIFIERIDVSDLPSLGRFIRTIPERMGGLHFSIHCAGILGPDYTTFLHELPDSHWDLVSFKCCSVVHKADTNR